MASISTRGGPLSAVLLVLEMDRFQTEGLLEAAFLVGACLKLLFSEDRWKGKAMEAEETEETEETEGQGAL
jgi:hypothetical protein